jgi:hypothetical protein
MNRHRPRQQGKLALAMLAATTTFIAGQALVPSPAVAMDDQGGKCVQLRELGLAEVDLLALFPECGSADNASGGDAGATTDSGPSPNADNETPPFDPDQDWIRTERPGVERLVDESGRMFKDFCPGVLSELERVRDLVNRLDAQLTELEHKGVDGDDGPVLESRVDVRKHRNYTRARVRFKNETTYWKNMGCENAMGAAAD